ncbi:hypothetical protein MMC25_003428 [Agyrium rufum]|nr:hypothetical protein [Agyrium rufum]
MPPILEEVYIAFRPVMKGPNALFRQVQPIRRLLVEHLKENPLTRDIVARRGVEPLVPLLAKLLKDRVFEDPARAAKCFPSLFGRNSNIQDQGPQRVVPQASVIQANAEVGTVAAGSGPSHVLPREVEQPLAINGLKGDCRMQQQSLSMKEGADADTQPHRGMNGCKIENCWLETLQMSSPASPTKPVPMQLNSAPDNARERLFSTVSFDFRTQHKVLIEIQKCLEQCCFRFTMHALPLLVERCEWIYPEALELNTWATQILGRWDRLPWQDFDLTLLNDTVTPKVLLSSVADIRHIAVHRVPLSADRLLQMIDSGIRLTLFLRDRTCTEVLELLRHRINEAAEALHTTRGNLETRLGRELEDIHRKRQELDDEEDDLIRQALRNDRQNKELRSKGLLRDLDQFFGSLRSAELEAVESSNNVDQSTVLEQQLGSQLCDGREDPSMNRVDGNHVSVIVEVGEISETPIPNAASSVTQSRDDPTLAAKSASAPAPASDLFFPGIECHKVLGKKKRKLEDMWDVPELRPEPESSAGNAATSQPCPTSHHYVDQNLTASYPSKDPLDVAVQAFIEAKLDSLIASYPNLLDTEALDDILVQDICFALRKNPFEVLRPFAKGFNLLDNHISAVIQLTLPNGQAHIATCAQSFFTALKTTKQSSEEGTRKRRKTSGAEDIETLLCDLDEVGRFFDHLIKHEGFENGETMMAGPA